MSRRRPSLAGSSLSLALDGRIAELAAERYPAAAAPMRQSERAAYWLGEYVQARRLLPHLTPSELLALIAEHDADAVGATFTRTIKRLAQQHFDSSLTTTKRDAASRQTTVRRGRQSSSTKAPIAEAQRADEMTPPSSSEVSADELDTFDVQKRLGSIRATMPVTGEQ